MITRRKPIPEFQNDAEERTFWENHDSAGSGNRRAFSHIIRW